MTAFVKSLTVLKKNKNMLYLDIFLPVGYLRGKLKPNLSSTLSISREGAEAEGFFS